MAVVKTIVNNIVLDIVCTKSLMDAHNDDPKTPNRLRPVLENLVETISKRFKLSVITDDLEGKANRKVVYIPIDQYMSDKMPTRGRKFLLILGLSCYSYGILFQSIHSGEYQEILIYDEDVLDFDITRLINDFLTLAQYRGNERVGSYSEDELMRRITSMKMINYGSDLLRTVEVLADKMLIEDQRVEEEKEEMTIRMQEESETLSSFLN